MLKQLLNECTIKLDLEPVGPILIKERGPETDEEKQAKKKAKEKPIEEPDMIFVRMPRNDGCEPYLPGSSIKGILRSRAEWIARSLNDAGSCNPFLTSVNEIETDLACSQRLKEVKGASAYRKACPICKLFGCLSLASRLSLTDAYLREDSRIPQDPRMKDSLGRERQQLPKPKNNEYVARKRDGVGIDRFLGSTGLVEREESAGGTKFDFEIINEGVFTCELYLRNFELWQLGLLGYLLTEMENAQIKIGYGKTRGLGKVRGKAQSVIISYIGKNKPPVGPHGIQFFGIGEIVQGEKWNDYGFDVGSDVKLNLALTPQDDGIRQSYYLSSEESLRLWKATLSCFQKYIQNYKPPE